MTQYPTACWACHPRYAVAIICHHWQCLSANSVVRTNLALRVNALQFCNSTCGCVRDCLYACVWMLPVCAYEYVYRYLYMHMCEYVSVSEVFPAVIVAMWEHTCTGYSPRMYVPTLHFAVERRNFITGTSRLVRHDSPWFAFTC